jgi:hypothetical protein
MKKKTSLPLSKKDEEVFMALLYTVFVVVSYIAYRIRSQSRFSSGELAL